MRQQPDPDFWFYVVLGFATVLVVVWALKKLAYRTREEALLPVDLPVNDMPRLPVHTSSVPPPDGGMIFEETLCRRCKEAPANEPMPSMDRSRGARDWFREFFAMPPRYRRVVRPDRLVLCKSCAHVADAMVDEFLHNRVRGAFAAAYTRVAIEAASFEKEFLQKQLSDSLTEEQKKAQKKLSSLPVARLLKTSNGETINN